MTCGRSWLSIVSYSNLKHYSRSAKSNMYIYWIYKLDFFSQILTRWSVSDKKVQLHRQKWSFKFDIKIIFLRRLENLTALTDLMEAGEGWDVTFNFVVEGVLLLLVAALGLAGNLASFVILMRQKVQKIFHNLLFLLSTFDTVSRLFLLWVI